MYLRYIIDYSEKDFADKLKKEINGDIGVELKINLDFLKEYAKKKQLGTDGFILDICNKGYFSISQNALIEDKRAEFAAEYPDYLKLWLTENNRHK